MGGVARSEPLVLVVDDEATVRQALERALRLEGFAVSTAADGLEALAAVAQRPPAVIVLDVMMPDLDGVSVVRRLRADGIDVPVCILSARDEVEDRVAGLQAGADDYLVKPFAIAELTARLQALLRRRGTEGAGPHMAGDVVVDPRRHVADARAAASSGSPAASSTCSTSSSATRARCSRATSCSRSCGATRPTSRRTSSTSSSATCGASSRRGRAADPAHGARRRLGAAAMRLPRSLRARIALAAVGAVALVRRARRRRCCSRRSSATAATSSTASCASASTSDPPPARSAATARRGGGAEPLLRGSGTFVQVAYGDEVGRAGGRRARHAAAASRSATASRRSTIAGTPWRSLTVTLAVGRQPAAPGAELARARRGARGLDPPARAAARLLALALTALAAWGFTTLAVRPLARLRAGAARVSGAEDLSTPLPDEGPEEVRPLAGALNEMLARLGASTAATERALEATRRFAADAGHELRTPLTGMRANLDTLARNPGLPAQQRDALVADMTAEQDRMVHLLEGLQALARGEAAESLPREPVELGDLARRRRPRRAQAPPGRPLRAGGQRRRGRPSTAGRAACG